MASWVDLNYSIEPRRVDAYLRKKPLIIDRHNSALSAFYYLSPEAALWVLPQYMISIITESKEDDFLIDTIFSVLASALTDGVYFEQADLGEEMVRLATRDEAAAVCAFCKWLAGQVDEDRSGANVGKALSLWCAAT